MYGARGGGPAHTNVEPKRWGEAMADKAKGGEQMKWGGLGECGAG